MTAPPAPMLADLRCHRCGYDLRAHQPDAYCPECGSPIAESIEHARAPARSAWRDSDPRWRRHMLAGVWLIVWLPLMDVLNISGWSAIIPMPIVCDATRNIGMLDGKFLSYSGISR